MDDVASSLLKFQKDLLDAKPGSDLAENLKAIGLSVEELKRIDPAEAYRQAAIALNQYNEAGNRALLTRTLFGNQTRQSAAYLKDLAESGQLVATVTRAQADEAEQFNKQLSAAQKAATDLGRALVADLLPGLNATLAKMREAHAEGARWQLPRWPLWHQSGREATVGGPTPSAPSSSALATSSIAGLRSRRGAAVRVSTPASTPASNRRAPTSTACAHRQRPRARN